MSEQQGLGDLSKHIQEMATNAIRPIQLKNEAEHKEIFIDPRTYQVTEIELPPKRQPDDIVFRCADEFIDHIISLESGLTTHPITWGVATEGAVALAFWDEDDDPTIRHTYHLNVDSTLEWIHLRDEIGGSCRISPDGILSLFERTFDAAMTASSKKFKQVLENLNWQAIKEARTRIEQAQIASGVESSARFSSEVGIPESFSLDIQVLKNMPDRLSVKVSVTPKPNEQSFCLRVHPQTFYDVSRQAVTAFLAPVFAGANKA